jgi:hypothetical protein
LQSHRRLHSSTDKPAANHHVAGAVCSTATGPRNLLLLLRLLLRVEEGRRGKGGCPHWHRLAHPGAEVIGYPTLPLPRRSLEEGCGRIRRFHHWPWLDSEAWLGCPLEQLKSRGNPATPAPRRHGPPHPQPASRLLLQRLVHQTHQQRKSHRQPNAKQGRFRKPRGPPGNRPGPERGHPKSTYQQTRTCSHVDCADIVARPGISPPRIGGALQTR